ncbi:hypothetical protein FHG87_020989 [Trinorchestia longiramus]|nr:hypothetical protein FHG87_020989 [Trinorchestia longiramus]
MFHRLANVVLNGLHNLEKDQQKKAFFLQTSVKKARHLAILLLVLTLRLHSKSTLVVFTQTSLLIITFDHAPDHTLDHTHDHTLDHTLDCSLDHTFDHTFDHHS